MRGGALLVNLFWEKTSAGEKGRRRHCSELFKVAAATWSSGGRYGALPRGEGKGGSSGATRGGGPSGQHWLKLTEAGGMGRGEERKGGPGAWAVMGLLPRPARNEWWCFVIIRKYSNGLN
jgi:hypothetical protein